MPYQHHPVGELLREEPKKARAKILKAFREVEGRTEQAATDLDVTKRTLDRWVGVLGIRKDVDRIREQAGRRSSNSYNPGGLQKKQRSRRK